MIDAIATTLWLALGIGAILAAHRRIDADDSRYVWACFWAHVLSTFVLIWLTRHVLGGGDMDMYLYYGEQLADYMRRDFWRWGPEVGRLILQLEADIPVRLYTSEGSSTSSLTGITAFALLINGGSDYATALAFALVAFTGQMGMYAAFRHHFPTLYRRRVLIALLLVPSVVFWTSGVVKEAIALGGIGWMIWGLNRLIVDQRRLRGLSWIVVGAVIVSVTKAYILFPMALAGGAWWFWHHSLATAGSVALAKKPLYLVAASLSAVVGILVLGELFPQYSIATLGEEAAQAQQAGAGAGGGSYYQLGNPDETSLTGQLAFAPLALMASFFRPFIFEAHNAVALINSLEMTAIVLLWIQILRTRGIRGSWRLISSSPALIFCLVFATLCGLGVGLTTTNLGTLSRYRVPMMPLYILLLLMVLPPASGSATIPADAADAANKPPPQNPKRDQLTSGTGR